MSRFGTPASRSGLVCVLALALAVLVRPAAADAPVSEAEVKAMVTALVERIRALHDPTRHWEP
ncbi:MAG: hypothetical protein RLZZ461_1202, partial [Planctomycetota bacterium]